ncbi:AAA family ATPase [Pelomyxa schiedti]|nr:AAA family ATPase [Pelomyxa schiedti]
MTTDEARATIRHILETSRVVWDNVVAPGWLETSSSPLLPQDGEEGGSMGADVFRAAGAMFPLVALACSRVLRRAREEGRSHYCALWAAGMAGSGACVSWIIAHHTRESHRGARRPRTSTVKEAGWVLCGLCDSGNVAAARSLFGGGGGEGDHMSGGGTFPWSLWDGSSEADASELRTDVMEYVKSGRAAGGRGWRNLESVKWLMSALRVGAGDSWVFMAALRLALWYGATDIMKWLESEFNLVTKLPEVSRIQLITTCASGHAPENVKWFAETFPTLPTGGHLLSTVMRNEHSTLEQCQWLRSHFPEEEISDFTLSAIRSSNIGKWALSSFPIEPGEGTLNRMCRYIQDTSFVEWLITERNFTPTAVTFACVCSTSQGGCTLPRWLSTKVKLVPADIQVSLERALSWNNTAIADWLESTFSVMGAVTASAEATAAMLVQLSQERGDFTNKVDGLHWFLQHIPHPEKIPAASVHKAISGALKYDRVNFALQLLEVFPKYKPQEGDTELLESILNALLRGSYVKLQRLMALFGFSLFTREMVATSMTRPAFRPSSGKCVKWAITQFRLEGTHIKHNHNRLLFSLILRKKPSCAEWLIDSFGITHDEVIDMFRHFLSSRGHYFVMDLQTWKMILRKFPRIDADVIRRHLMRVAVISPSIATFTMNQCGITIEEIRHQFDRLGHFENPEHRARLTTELRMWLGLTGGFVSYRAPGKSLWQLVWKTFLVRFSFATTKRFRLSLSTVKFPLNLTRNCNISTNGINTKKNNKCLPQSVLSPARASGTTPPARQGTTADCHAAAPTTPNAPTSQTPVTPSPVPAQGTTATATVVTMTTTTTATPSPPTSMPAVVEPSAYTKLKRFMEGVARSCIDREEATIVGLVALLMGEHCLFLGPSGTAKSMLAHTMLRYGCNMSPNRYFELALHAGTSMNDIVGPVDLVVLNGDKKAIRDRRNHIYVDECVTAFLDEIFKAPPSTLTVLLSLLNKDDFNDGEKMVKSHLHTVFSASKEIPLESNQGALLDRFFLRVFVDGISEKRILYSFHQSPPAEFPEPRMDFPFVRDFADAAKEAIPDPFPEQMQDLLSDFDEFVVGLEPEKHQVDDMAETHGGSLLTDRSRVKLGCMAQVIAHAHNRQKVHPYDLYMFVYAVWKTKEQFTKVSNWMINRLRQIPLDFAVLQDHLFIPQRVKDRLLEAPNSPQSTADVRNPHTVELIEIENFRAAELLGTGSSSAVFRVQNRNFHDGDMVIKVLFNWENAQQVQQAIPECGMLSLLPPHENVINPLGSFVIPYLPAEFAEKIPLDQPFFKELCNNKSLAILMPHCGFTLPSFFSSLLMRCSKALLIDNFQSLFVQGLQAIHHIESHFVVHRDIKGDNVLVDPESGKLTLVDFGEAQHCPNLQMVLSATTQAWGNAGTIPPELSALLKSVTRGTGSSGAVFSYSKCDSFALALTFYNVLLPPEHKFIGSVLNHDMSVFSTHSLLSEFPFSVFSSPMVEPPSELIQHVMIGMMNPDKGARLPAADAIELLTS